LQVDITGSSPVAEELDKKPIHTEGIEKVWDRKEFVETAITPPPQYAEDIASKGYVDSVATDLDNGPRQIETVSTNTTLDASHTVVLVSGARTITLPLAASFPNKLYHIKQSDAAASTIARSGSDTIDGATSLTLTGIYKLYTVVSDGNAWWVLASY